MNKYEIGELTMAYVFKRNGITDVSDMQAVFDAMESALVLKNEHIIEVAKDYLGHRA